MENGLIKKTEQDKTIDLMCQILELKDASEIVVKKSVSEMGLKKFFLNYPALDLEAIEKERIKALKEVIEQKEEEISVREGGALYGN